MLTDMDKTFSSRFSSGSLTQNIRINYFVSPKMNSFSSFFRKSYAIGSILFLFVAISFSACKDPEELGLDVLPNSDQIFILHSDSTTLVTRTTKEDSLVSGSVSYQLLGSYSDPVFGRSDASFYTQIRLGLAAVFGNSTDVLVPDSLILSLLYSGHYGDTTQPQTIHVYRLNEPISTDSIYYTSKVFSTLNPLTDLANGYTYTPMPNTAASVLSADQPAQLRIPLALDLADSILALNGQSTIADNASWFQYFKGLYIKTDPVTMSGKGAISYFDLNNSYSKMTLYFHNVTTGDDSLKYVFVVTNTTSVNHQEHDYNGILTDVGHQLMDSTYSDSLNYIQSLAGLKTKITFPYFAHLKDSGNILLNKAELEITIQSGSTDFYSGPSKLFLVYSDSSGRSFFMTDYYEGTSYFGGSYNSSDRTYRFNIARHLQKILNGTLEDNGLYLLVSGAVVQASRVIVTSGKNPVNSMKLNLYYTKLH